MKWLLEILASVFKGHRAETRADFDSVARQWEDLATAMNLRMTEAFARLDRVQGELDAVVAREILCRAHLAAMEMRLRQLEGKSGTTKQQDDLQTQ